MLSLRIKSTKLKIRIYYDHKNINNTYNTYPVEFRIILVCYSPSWMKAESWKCSIKSKLCNICSSQTFLLPNEEFRLQPGRLLLSQKTCYAKHSNLLFFQGISKKQYPNLQIMHKLLPPHTAFVQHLQFIPTFLD